MNEDQTGESSFAGISVRAWVTLMLVMCICYMSIAGLEVKEPLYTLVGMAVGWYFGQKTKERPTDATPPTSAAGGAAPPTQT